MQELEVPREFRRGSRNDEEASIASAMWLIEHISSHIGLDDLGETEVLDVGCGVKFTQAFLNHSLPIGRYTGLDVYREMIDFLRESVDDPRFEYFHINAHNEMYNPRGEPLRDTTLPLGDRTFDLICLLSVFTHLAPEDYRTMLELLRPHVKPDGRLFYTLFIDELTAGGHGLMDGWARRLGPTAVGSVETFRDLNPEQPLKWALYSRRYAHELIAGTGWEVVSLSPPLPHAQHHFVCAPS